MKGRTYPSTHVIVVSDFDGTLATRVSLFYVNDTGSIGSRGRTVGIPTYVRLREMGTG